MTSSAQTQGLAALESRIRQDLDYLGLPAKNWTIPASHPEGEVKDVVIVGGGMSGLAVAAALAFNGVDAEIYDQSPAGLEGPWATTARMITLRSPKELPGPCLGIPSLTFRAWYEAQHGLEGWQQLDKIHRLSWMEYLRWYREVLQLKVHNLQKLVDVEARADGVVALSFRDDTSGQTRRVLARHAVLATGRDGLGGASLPAWAARLPSSHWVHSGAAWSGEMLRGRNVTVIGGGSSAMDAAATALEHGARSVSLLIRRHDLPRINKSKGTVNPGMAHGFRLLSDEWKWKVRHYLNTTQVPPPHSSTLRVSQYPNASFHFGIQVETARLEDDRVVLSTNLGEVTTDFVIFCTGFCTDWAQRPEYARIAGHVRLWQDHYPSLPGAPDRELAGSPYLGSLYQFLEKQPGSLPGLERIHCFNYAAALSQGASAGDIPQVSDGAQRLASGLIASLLAEDVDQHYARLQQYDEPELDGSEWRAAASPLPDQAHL
ncbi:nucleoside-diphosphate-sugar epimerases [Aquitalea magnusonii]|uniref:Nucleoside-diphosphate-sugar epimerases n=1 Tax=Aquitalea magnusonii TaxID=332411 RepID=A0A3G9GAT8_9NEIS|nr:NAD(P)/FAD-dependent oxidoreductase [Aquitalea magnusonii]BBF85008.1 nucleoside-diphosphate-sugar epimerases [Aquitalea magnusonii]